MKYQSSVKKTAFFLLSIVVVLFLSNKPAKAAKIFLETSNFLENGKIFYKINSYLDTERESFNVIDGKMFYPEEKLNFARIESGGSVVSTWLNGPKKSSQGVIGFTGGITSGFVGERGFLFSAIFSLKEGERAGLVEFLFQDLAVNFSDGSGGQKQLDNVSYIVDLGSVEQELLEKDEDPPEIFAPYVTRDSSLQGGRWVVIFSAQDKGSGIDYYEIFESTERRDKEKITQERSINWKKAEELEAYVLEDQGLESFIYIKAVDKAGNARVAEVIPAHYHGEKATKRKSWVAALVILAVSFVLLRRFKSRNNKRR